MQGTVWGSLCCTASMDKLGQLVYNNSELLYKYKGEVDIPSLGMVDDILSIQKCSSDSMQANAVINAFVESKKLTLSKEKCHRIHIEKKRTASNDCLELKVHDDKMHDSTKEKYLGDILDESGKIRQTVEERRGKGFAIVNEILAILEEVPLGKYKMEIGLELRQAMLLNGVLFNSEAWHNVTEKEMKRLEEVDEYLLRSLVKGHAKTPLEFLYLESGAIPIRHIVASRRMVYLQTILKRDDSELTKRIYMSQKQSATVGDFYNLVKADYEEIEEVLDEDEIAASSVNAHKKKIKSKTREAALKYLKSKQQTHSKVKDIQYDKLETQRYMTSPLFSDEEVSLLFALRSKCVRECKANFSSMYSENGILCVLCTENKSDDQPHLLQCKAIARNLNSDEVARGQISYMDIYGDHNKQKAATALLSKLVNIKKTMTENSQPSALDPSTLSDLVLKFSYDLHDCIVDYSSGKYN